MRITDLVDVESVSHELKAPLSVLLAQLELMNYHLDDKSKLRGFLSVASQNSCRLTRLTGNLLDLLRIDAGRVKADLTVADIFSLLKDVCGSAVPYAKAKSIDLICEAPQYGRIMPVDVEKTERVLFNLLSNAIRFTEEKGRITVTIEDHLGKGIAFSVEDTGRGIPEDALCWLFDPARAASSPAQKPEGAGLGLALVKSFVEILGGRIAAASKPGEGSKFTVELPVPQRAADAGINVYGFALDKKAKIELSDSN